MTDPDFDRFFASDFQRLLERTSIPGMGEASWDRRAAWLLWRAMHPDITPSQYINVGLDGKIIPPGTPNIVTISSTVFD